jgi:hypothetical protein
MTGSRIKVLIAVAVVLLAVRFLIVPWIDYQSEMRDRLLVRTERLDRASWVLGNKVKIEKAQISAVSALQSVRSRFVEFAAVEPFQLDTQQKVNQIAASRSVRVNAFEWVLDEPVDEGIAHRSRARFMALGRVGDLAAFQGELEALFATSSVVEANLVSSASDGGSAGTLSVVMDFYFIRSAKTDGSRVGQ